MPPPDAALLCVPVFAVAALYAAVGHGGASGYLAVLALASAPKDVAVTSALLLNLLVASLAFAAFRKNGHFRWSLVWPFLAGSIPAAYLGGLLKIGAAAYSMLLAAALSLTAVRMWLPSPSGAAAPQRAPPLLPALSIGAAIGLLSGMIGIGGGVFLSPLLLLAGWADPKQAAAASSCFIVANSLAALSARWGRAPELPASFVVPLLVSACAGGWIGARTGSGRISPAGLRRLLGAVLWIASVKLLLR